MAQVAPRPQPAEARRTAQGGRETADRSARAVNPRVVLGMTLFNNARHLREAADSLLAQTYGDFALIMLDDASEDDTERIARDYEQRDSRIRYLRHAQRQGMVPTWRE